MIKEFKAEHWYRFIPKGKKEAKTPFDGEGMMDFIFTHSSWKVKRVFGGFRHGYPIAERGQRVQFYGKSDNEQDLWGWVFSDFEEVSRLDVINEIEELLDD